MCVAGYLKSLASLSEDGRSVCGPQGSIMSTLWTRWQRDVYATILADCTRSLAIASRVARGSYRDRSSAVSTMSTAG